MSSSSESPWHLRILDDGGAEVEIPVGRTPKCIGRDEQRVDIRLLSAQVSRRHAEVWVESDGRLMVKDLKSTNGTEVNGHRLEAEPCCLIHGDMLRIARWEFTACDRAAAEAMAAQKPEQPAMSSADSIAAIDALLDSRGNLLEDLHRAAKPARPSTAKAAPAAEKPVEKAVEKTVEKPVAKAAAEAAPRPVAAKPVARPVRQEVRITDELEADDHSGASIMGATMGATMAGQFAPVTGMAAKAPAKAPAPEPMAMVREDAVAIAADSGIINCATVGDFVDSGAGKLLFDGSQAGLPGLDDSCATAAPTQPAARARDLHLVGEGRAPGVSAADLCAVQAFAERQLVVPNPAKRQRLLCEFITGPVFRKNLSAVVSVQEGRIEPVGTPVSSLPGAGLHIEKTLVRCAAREKRAVVAWDAHFLGGASAVAVCAPLANGEYLYSVTTFENATPAWMSLLAQTAFMDRLIRKSWAAIDKVRRPDALPMVAAA